MSSANKLLQAAAYTASASATYVDDVFASTPFGGDGNSGRALVSGIDVSTDGGLVWCKDTTAATAANHMLFDTVRGVNKILRTNSTSVQETLTSGGGLLTAFGTNGFTVNHYNASSPSGITGDQFNINSGINQTNSIAWSFKKTPGFFDVVTYTGDASDDQAISHSLGSVPGAIIIKRLDGTFGWYIYHRSLGTGKYLDFGGNASTTQANIFDVTPTDSTFYVGGNNGVNASGSPYIAYLFAHDDQSFGAGGDESIVKCGTQSNSGSGTSTVTLGWEPQFVLWKADSASNWYLLDTNYFWGASQPSTQPDQGTGYALFPDSNAAKSNMANPSINVTSTGFTVDGSWAGTNTGYYIAVRRPHKPASEFSNTTIFTPVNGSGNPRPNYESAFWPVGFAWAKRTAAVGRWRIVSRLTAKKSLQFNDTTIEDNWDDASFEFTNPSGAIFGGYDSNYRGFLFRRCPKFSDVIAYTGTGSATTVTHSLDAVPELMIIKNREETDNWAVYHKNADGSSPQDKYLHINLTNAVADSNAYWNDTAPTASVFSVGTDHAVNQTSEQYIAYIFASVSGLVKVGSYSGTGSAVNVDCGFSAGARFVLIKRNDSTGDWFVFDSVGGIVAGNDPYVVTTSTAAAVTGTDYIDPLSSGFTITSSAPAELNASGGTYIFLAIA